MDFEMERSPEKIHLIKIEKKKPRGIDLNPPLMFTFLELTIARLRKPDIWMSCIFPNCTIKIVFCLIAGYKTKKKLIRIDKRPPPSPAPTPGKSSLGGGSKTGPGRRRKSSPQTHLFMLNMQVNNQSNLNTKWKYYSLAS